MTQVNPLTFTIALTLTAHRYAENFRKQQINPAKAKQVYLNTLAVYAVKEYLDYLEIETDLEASQSWNPVQQTLLDTTSLKLTQRGTLECRPVLPWGTHLKFPPETPRNSAAGIAVLLDNSLRSATLLGFVASIPDQAIPLNELQNLEQLGVHLNTLTSKLTIHSDETLVTQLQQWLETDGDFGLWKVISYFAESFISRPNYVFDFRESAKTVAEEITGVPIVSRSKHCCLGQEPHTKTVELQVGIQKISEEMFNIYTQVKAMKPHDRLPENLHISVLDHDGTEVMHAQSLGTEALQLKFSTVKDEHFQLQLMLDGSTITETFIS